MQETIAKYINVTDAVSRLATSEGIDPKGLVRNEQEFRRKWKLRCKLNNSATNASWYSSWRSETAGNIPSENITESLSQLQEQIGQ